MICKKSNELRALANLARQRLLNKDYTETKNEKDLLKNKVSAYFIENAKAMKRLRAETKFVSISEKEDADFIRKVVLSIKQDELNSLGKLTDEKYYNSLDDREKQLYMLKLSEKLNKIKDAYERNLIPSELIA